MDVIELVPAVPDLPFERAQWSGSTGATPCPAGWRSSSGAAPPHAHALQAAGEPARSPDKTFNFEVPSGVAVVDQ